MATYKTPGVYVEEVSLHPPSVTEVETAVPAFIGYTEMARRTNDDDLRLVPTRIASLAEYERYFGGPKDDPIAVTVARESLGGFRLIALDVAGTRVVPADDARPPAPRFFLHQAMRMYFENGGSACVVVSVGGYADAPAPGRDALLRGLEAAGAADEPTLLVVPEAVTLDEAGYGEVVRGALLQCGTLRNRFAILDLLHGTDPDRLDDDRAAFGTAHLEYGAAYFPFVKAAVNRFVRSDPKTRTSNVRVTIEGTGETGDLLSPQAFSDARSCEFVRGLLARHHVAMPPSGAVAGIYAATDARRGVWKAPANELVRGVIEPLVRLDDSAQAAFNLDPATGKSVNVLRVFAGSGTFVWGARTLAGNDDRWRYVPVRRFFIMLEDSVRKAMQWVVFEPNDAGTWNKVRRMIESYLTGKWREGALAGAEPEQAFFVECGLGTTMTQEDIQEGRVIVRIGTALVQPAQFMTLSLSAKMGAA